MKYRLFFHSAFRRHLKKYVRKNPFEKNRVHKVLSYIEENPYHPSLKTHKVESKSGEKIRSSWLTGDMRIL